MQTVRTLFICVVFVLAASSCGPDQELRDLFVGRFTGDTVTVIEGSNRVRVDGLRRVGDRVTIETADAEERIMIFGVCGTMTALVDHAGAFTLDSKVCPNDYLWGCSGRLTIEKGQGVLNGAELSLTYSGTLSLWDCPEDFPVNSGSFISTANLTRIPETP